MQWGILQPRKATSSSKHYFFFSFPLPSVQVQQEVLIYCYQPVISPIPVSLQWLLACHPIHLSSSPMDNSSGRRTAWASLSLNTVKFPWNGQISLILIFLLQTQYLLLAQFSACSSMHFISSDYPLTFDLQSFLPLNLTFPFLTVSNEVIIQSMCLYYDFPVKPSSSSLLCHLFFRVAVLCCKPVTSSCLGSLYLPFPISAPGFPVSSRQHLLLF